MTLRNIFKIILYSLRTLTDLMAIYLCCACIGSCMTTSREDVTEATVPVYIMTNGVHTDIVVPVRTSITDWSREVLFTNTASGDTAMQYIAFGWGDKGFYLETPTWADLTMRTACKAAFGLGHAAMHTTYYKTMQENADCIHINISTRQYARLASYIRSSFTTGADGHFLPVVTSASYGANDAFYEARGRYSLFHTCNTWANNALKSCGQTACLWTPFDKGIFYHYR